MLSIKIQDFPLMGNLPCLFYRNVCTIVCMESVMVRTSRI